MTVGKSIEGVEPVTYTLPEESIAIPDARSLFEPPKAEGVEKVRPTKDDIRDLAKLWGGGG